MIVYGRLFVTNEIAQHLLWDLAWFAFIQTITKWQGIFIASHLYKDFLYKALSSCCWNVEVIWFIKWNELVDQLLSWLTILDHGSLCKLSSGCLPGSSSSRLVLLVMAKSAKVCVCIHVWHGFKLVYVHLGDACVCVCMCVVPSTVLFAFCLELAYFNMQACVA